MIFSKRNTKSANKNIDANDLRKTHLDKVINRAEKVSNKIIKSANFMINEAHDKGERYISISETKHNSEFHTYIDRECKEVKELVLKTMLSYYNNNNFDAELIITETYFNLCIRW